MNSNQIKHIEDSLNIKLLDYYKSTMLEYPYPKDSFADECLLPNDPDIIIKNNNTSLLARIRDVSPFFIGNDGGEESYYVDLKNENSKVYVYCIETDKSEIEWNSWQDYLKKIEKDLKEIEEDERRMEERKKNKKWWEFWI